MKIIIKLTIGCGKIKFNSLEELQNYHFFDKIQNLFISGGLKNIPKLPNGLQVFDCGYNKKFTRWIIRI